MYTNGIGTRADAAARICAFRQSKAKRCLLPIPPQKRRYSFNLPAPEQITFLSFTFCRADNPSLEGALRLLHAFAR